MTILIITFISLRIDSLETKVGVNFEFEHYICSFTTVCVLCNNIFATAKLAADVPSFKN